MHSKNASSISLLTLPQPALRNQTADIQMAQMDLTHPAGEWRNGLFSGICGADNAGLCLGSWFCSPCLYGQTTARLEQFPNPESPDFVGGNCFLMYAAGCCGFNWVVALMKRKEVREKFGIIGNTGMDCLVSKIAPRAWSRGWLMSITSGLMFLLPLHTGTDGDRSERPREARSQRRRGPALRAAARWNGVSAAH